MPETVEFSELVDTLLENFGQAGVPVLTMVIAEVLADLFYRYEPQEKYQQYRVDLESFVRSRLRILVCGRAN